MYRISVTLVTFVAGLKSIRKSLESNQGLRFWRPPCFRNTSLPNLLTAWPGLIPASHASSQLLSHHKWERGISHFPCFALCVSFHAARCQSERRTESDNPCSSALNGILAPRFPLCLRSSPKSISPPGAGASKPPYIPPRP